MWKKELIEILIAMVQARKDAAEAFTMNRDMYFVSHLCEAEIEALTKMLEDV